MTTVQTVDPNLAAAQAALGNGPGDDASYADQQAYITQLLEYASSLDASNPAGASPLGPSGSPGDVGGPPVPGDPGWVPGSAPPTPGGGGAAAPPVVTTPPPAPAATSGTAAVKAVLSLIGLGNAKANDGTDLATWMLNDLRQNSGMDLTTASSADITAFIDVELPKQTAFQTRFPGIMEQLAAGETPTSPVDYISWEDSAKAVAAQYGLDYDSVFTPDVVAANIVGQVSPNELQSRFDTYYAGVIDAPPEVLQAYEQFYGVNGAHGLAMQIAGQDPSTLLKQQMETAQIQGAGATLGLNVNQDRATQLAQLGVTYSSALTSLRQLTATSGLYTPTVGEAAASTGKGAAPTITENDQGITATLGTAGLADPTANAAATQLATQQVEQRQLERQNSFQGGGGGEGAPNTGITGLGAANSA